MKVNSKIDINMPRDITLTTYRGITMPSTVYSDNFDSNQ